MPYEKNNKLSVAERIHHYVEEGHIVYSSQRQEYAVLWYSSIDLFDVFHEDHVQKFVSYGLDSREEFDTVYSDVDLSKDKFFKLKPMKKIDHLEYLLLENDSEQ